MGCEGGSSSGTRLVCFASSPWPGLQPSLRFQSAVTNITLKCEVVGKEERTWGERERQRENGREGEREAHRLEGEQRGGGHLNAYYVPSLHPFLDALLQASLEMHTARSCPGLLTLFITLCD